MDKKQSKNKPPIITEIIYKILSNFFIDLESYWAVIRHIQTLNANDQSRPLWIVFSNNCLMMAAVEWCKVFGSEKNNKTHYTKCIAPLEGIKEISNDMRDFRDKYISHYDFYENPIPFMDRAVKVVERFDQAMLEKYESKNQEPTAKIILRYRKDVQRSLRAIITGNK